jgi:hypothetical protein
MLTEGKCCGVLLKQTAMDKTAILMISDVLEEEDDDDIELLALMALSMVREKRQFWVHPILLKRKRKGEFF